jgi:hypothetical protein
VDEIFGTGKVGSSIVPLTTSDMNGQQALTCVKHRPGSLVAAISDLPSDSRATVVRRSMLHVQYTLAEQHAADCNRSIMIRYDRQAALTYQIPRSWRLLYML